MEHSMFVSLVLILMLLGLVALIFAIIKLINIAKELGDIKEKLETIHNHGREKKLFFKTKLKGIITVKDLNIPDEKNDSSNSQVAMKEVEGENPSTAANDGITPINPGPKSVTIELSGPVDISS